MKVLFCSLDSPGFLFPAIGLAAELRSRGHSVAFVTGLEAKPYLDHAGMLRIPCGARDARTFETPYWYHPLAVALQVRHIHHAVTSFAPDLLVGQPLTLAPSMVCEQAGLPLIVQGLATHLWPGGGPRSGVSATADERCRWRHCDMMRHLNAARRTAGLPLVDSPPAASPLHGDLLLLRSVPALHGGPGEPGRLHLVGACLWEPRLHDTALDRWLEAARRRGAPIVYVQPGRAFGSPGFWRLLMESFACGPIAMAVSTGRMDGDGSTGDSDSEHLFLRRHINQSLVLPHACLTIGSATTNSVLGALTHALPSLLIPAGGEQLDLAEQVERAGAAKVLAADALTAESLLEATLDALGDSALSHGARQLGRAFASLDGFALSADLIERFPCGPISTLPRPESFCIQETA
jgi:UDP:flavonoid glycosyltransferase YjiC (YdhE family)